MRIMIPISPEDPYLRADDAGGRTKREVVDSMVGVRVGQWMQDDGVDCHTETNGDADDEGEERQELGIMKVDADPRCDWPR